MTERVLLYREQDGTSYEIETPPVSSVEIGSVAAELDVPVYVDMSYCPMERAILSLWAAARAPTSMRLGLGWKSTDAPLVPLLLGGAAVKMLCPSANSKAGPLNRRINDLDYVTRKNQAGKFVLLLSNLSGLAGSRYYHFLTSSDKRFNAIRAGDRYRIRAVDWSEDGRPTVTSVDVFAEKIEMRHRIEVKREFDVARQNNFTIGPEKLLISKCQLIMDAEKSKAKEIEDSGQGFRVLRYPHYREDRFILGMEEKDMIDVCALLQDRGQAEDGISLPKMRAELRDQRFLLTVRLNLENVLSRTEWMRRKGLSESQISRILEAGSEILRGLPAVDKKWPGPWWNTGVETPAIV